MRWNEEASKLTSWQVKH